MCFHLLPYKALRVSLDNPVIAKRCLDLLLNIIRVLPYLGNGVYDSKLIMDVSDTLFRYAEDAGNVTDQGLCKTIKAYFSPVRTKQEQEDVTILVS